ncbi:hypothetical protein ACFFU9_10840 [Mariniflexile ostreae]|uniref:Lipoprotein n=1 Tax=Mariniflexile ostreae TaxID=1520892 RepID=A0ABV5FCR1_9FLAO
MILNITNKTNIFTLVFLALISSCLSQTQNQYTIVNVASVYTESVINNDSVSSIDKIKSVENVVAVFSKKKDTVTTYVYDSEHYQGSIGIRKFTSIKTNKNNRFFISEFFRDTVKVSFEEASRIGVNKDIYTVSKPYYSFLKEKILKEGSILHFVSLIKDGYGDYCALFSPLIDYRWTKTRTDVAYKILQVLVTNEDFQSSDGRLNTWKIVYKNDAAKGKYFEKCFLEENKKYKVYKTEYDNERFHVSTTVFSNTKTLLDSVSASWESYGQNMEKYQIDYQKKQTKLDLLKTHENPKNLNEIIKILGEIKTD